jgi:hypothetical protein
MITVAVLVAYSLTMLKRLYSKIMGHPRYRWAVILASLRFT